MLKHNKKRNVGLINEFCSRYMARAIIEHKDSDLTKAKSILQKHFQKDTNLFKELKLFNALYKTKVQNKEAAWSLINQVKESCRISSQSKLDLEKTALLHEINCTLGDPNFFNKVVPDYKICATIQVLMDTWRNASLQESNISESSQLEDKLLEHMVLTPEIHTSASNINKNVLEMTDNDINQLVVNIMLEKLTKKFGNLLGVEQKDIINMYVFSSENHETGIKLSETLETIRVRTITLINEELKVNQKDVYTNNKLSEIKTMLETDYRNVSSPKDDTITFYLTVLKLEKELCNKNG